MRFQKKIAKHFKRRSFGHVATRVSTSLLFLFFFFFFFVSNGLFIRAVFLISFTFLCVVVVAGVQCAEVIALVFVRC